jgi:signal transduction histidine kinase
MLAKLLRRYPEGKIFNFDEHGYASSRDSSGEEDAVRIPEPQDVVMRQVLTQATTGRGSRHQQHNDGSAIIKIFSGARSIALVPVWDSRRQRWFAGGFAFTKNPRRILTLEGELSYLRAFGTVVMAEISRAEIALADGAKSDALSSISHELRSPLHGLLLATELLSYSKFDAFQGNMLHTIETCGRTLLGEYGGLWNHPSSHLAN